ncbi:MAG: M50 family metallopeptidase [Thermodesulfobacteriota bacterium]|nr:M50 family metallopeptidase [Thermodesulfobacteriota bacterium]
MITSTINFASLFMLMIMLITILRFFHNRIQTKLYQLAGWKGIVITGSIGVFLHEMSHALTAILFCHKITEFKPYLFNRSSGSLGYVGHTWNNNSIYQQCGLFFIAIAPCVLGTLAVYSLILFLVPNADQVIECFATVSLISQTSISNYLQSSVLISFQFLQQVFAFQNFSSAKYWIFLFLAGSIIIHMVPSATDLRHAGYGLVILFLLSLCFLLLVWLIGRDKIVVVYINYFAVVLNYILTLACLFSIACYLMLISILFLRRSIPNVSS